MISVRLGFTGGLSAFKDVQVDVFVLYGQRIEYTPPYGDSIHTHTHTRHTSLSLNQQQDKFRAAFAAVFLSGDEYGVHRVKLDHITATDGADCSAGSSTGKIFPDVVSGRWAARVCFSLCAALTKLVPISTTKPAKVPS